MSRTTIVVSLLCTALSTCIAVDDISESACREVVGTLFTATQAEDAAALDRVLAAENPAQAALAAAYRHRVVAYSHLAHVATARFPDAAGKLPPFLAEIVNGRTKSLADAAAQAKVVVHGDSADVTLMDQPTHKPIVTLVLDHTRTGWMIRSECLFGLSASAPVDRKDQAAASELRFAQGADAVADALRDGRYASVGQAMNDFNRTYMEVVMSQIPTTQPSTAESTHGPGHR